MENKILIIDEIKKVLGYHFKDSGDLRKDIIKSIENIVIEYRNIEFYIKHVQYNKDLIIESFIISFLKNIKRNDFERLSILLYYISQSDQLKKIFDIERRLNDSEANDLVNKIFSSILYLDFNKKEEISNYVIEFSKKYINNEEEEIE